MKIDFKFELNEEVYITRLQITGRVEQISIGVHGVKYEVRYFNNIEPKDVWFYPDELEIKCNKNTSINFIQPSVRRSPDHISIGKEY